MPEKDETPKEPDSSPHSKIDTKLAVLTILESFKNNPAAKAEFTTRLLNDPQVKGLVYRSRSKGPYYNKKCGMELKPLLDQMIADHKSRAFYAKKFGVSVDTLKLRIHQSFEYLQTDMEMLQLYGNIYADLRRRTDICIENKTDPSIAAVVIRFDDDPDLDTNRLIPLQAEIIDSPIKDHRVWRKILDDYLADGKLLKPLDLRQGISLTDAEVADLDDELGIIEGILATVEKTRIRVVKYNGE